MGKSFFKELLLKHATVNLGCETTPKCRLTEVLKCTPIGFILYSRKLTSLNPKKGSWKKGKTLKPNYELLGSRTVLGCVHPPKINMEPKNEPIEKEHHFPFTSIFWFPPLKKNGISFCITNFGVEPPTLFDICLFHQPGAESLDRSTWMSRVPEVLDQR